MPVCIEAETEVAADAERWPVAVTLNDLSACYRKLVPALERLFNLVADVRNVLRLAKRSKNLRLGTAASHMMKWFNVAVRDPKPVERDEERDH